MVLVGKVNKEIVSLINAHGGSAVGLSGEDASLITAAPANHVDELGNPVELGYVGKVQKVDTSVLDLLAQQTIPVVASVAADERGQTYNINADTVAGELAAALHAEKIVFLSDVGGIYSTMGLEETIVSECSLAEIGALQAAGGISGGMIPKIGAVRRALEAGVASAHIIDGRVEHALLLEILTDAGCGTKVVP
jgi:acetylglutamate kinase